MFFVETIASLKIPITTLTYTSVDNCGGGVNPFPNPYLENPVLTAFINISQSLGVIKGFTTNVKVRIKLSLNISIPYFPLLLLGLFNAELGSDSALL